MVHLTHVLDKQYPTFPELQTQYQLPSFQFFAIGQVLGFLKSRVLNITRVLAHNSFESLLGPLTERHNRSMLHWKLRKGDQEVGLPD